LTNIALDFAIGWSGG